MGFTPFVMGTMVDKALYSAQEKGRNRVVQACVDATAARIIAPLWRLLPFLTRSWRSGTFHCSTMLIFL